MIRKISELPVADIEKPMPTPVIKPLEENHKAKNQEVFTDKKALTPIVNKSLEEEMRALNTLKDAQSNLQGEVFRHIQGTKNTVIYFNQVVVKANDDVMNATGPNDTNATKYNRIDNMVIMFPEEVSPNFEGGDDGIVKNDLEGRGTMVPGFTPYVGDLFYSKEQKELGTLYQVTSVEPMSTYSESAFNITFTKYYDQFSPEQMIDKISNYYVFNYDAVGTKASKVLERSMYEVYNAAIEAYRRISSEYLSRYYNRIKNIIFFNENTSYEEKADYSGMSDAQKVLHGLFWDINVVDPYVIKFLGITLFARHPLEYKSFTINPYFPLTLKSDIHWENKYKYSIYSAIQLRDKSYIHYRYFYPEKYYPSSLKDMSYKDWCFFDLRESKTEACVDFYPQNLLSRIINNVEYLPKDKDYRYNPIIKFFNIEGYIPSLEEFNAMYDKIEFADYSSFYGAAPLLLYLSAYFQELIQQNEY